MPKRNQHLPRRRNMPQKPRERLTWEELVMGLIAVVLVIASVTLIIQQLAQRAAPVINQPEVQRPSPVVDPTSTVGAGIEIPANTQFELAVGHELTIHVRGKAVNRDFTFVNTQKGLEAATADLCGTLTTSDEVWTAICDKIPVFQVINPRLTAKGDTVYGRTVSYSATIR